MAWRIQYIEDIRDNKRSYHLNTWLVHLWVQSCFIKLPSFGPSLELIFVDENVSNLNYVYAHIAHIEYPMIFITSFRVSFFFNLKTMFSSYFVYSYRIRATVMHMHVQKFAPQLREMGVYLNSNFRLYSNPLYFKPSNSDYQIFFTCNTVLMPYNFSFIPVYGFQFTPFSTIKQLCHDKRYVVGIQTSTINFIHNTYSIIKFQYELWIVFYF